MRTDVCPVVPGVPERPEFAFIFSADSRAEVRVAGELGGQLVEGRSTVSSRPTTGWSRPTSRTGAPPSSRMGAPDGCRDQVGDDAALLADVYAGRAIRGMLFDVEGPV